MARKNQLIKKEDTASLSNVLNEMFYEEKMTLQELRFFLIYLSKINPKEPNKTEISFTLEEYSNLLGVELNEKTILAVTRKLLRYVVCTRPKVLDEDIAEQYDFCQLFSKSTMKRRKSDNKWFLTFACHDMIKEHLFDLKAEYTSLEVWNIVNLSNFQDARMYMLLRQYRRIGERTIDLKELKKMLGIDINAYPEYKVFARDVLKKCQKALKQNTDICFDFNAVGRPAKAVHFDIYENKNYKLPKFLEESKELEGQQAIPGVIDAPLAPEDDPESADYAPLFDDIGESVPAQPLAADGCVPTDPRQLNYTTPHYLYLAGACDYEFKESDIKELDTIMYDRGMQMEDTQFDFLRKKYVEMVAAYNRRQNTSRPIRDRYKWLKWLVENTD